jgi:hypothetical protein
VLRNAVQQALGLSAAVAKFCDDTGACHLGGDDAGLLLYRKGEANNSGLGLNRPIPEPISFWNSLTNRLAWATGSFQTGKDWYEISTAKLPQGVVAVPTDPSDDVPTVDNNGHYSIFNVKSSEDIKVARTGNRGKFGPDPYAA